MVIFGISQISNVITHLASKSVPAFQWAPVGMFRTQGQLLTPFQLRETPGQRVNQGEFTEKISETSLY